MEFRHKSWLSDENREETLELLESHQLPFVCVDMPQGFKSSVPPVVAATSSELAVMRFHGHNDAEWESGSVQKRFRYLYSKRQLRPWVPKLEELASQAREVHALMNNCYRDHGVRNAMELQEMLNGD